MQIDLNHDSRNPSKFKRNFPCAASKCAVSYFLFVCWRRQPCSWWGCFKCCVRYTGCSYIRTNWGRWLHLCCSKWSFSCCRARLIQILKWKWIYTLQPDLMAAVQLYCSKMNISDEIILLTDSLQNVLDMTSWSWNKIASKSQYE